VKVECKHSGGLLQPITILEWKWVVISLEFITGFPKAMRQHDSIMVFVDRLTKVRHSISVKSTFAANDVPQVFIRDVVILNGVPKRIVSNRYVKFTSMFLKELFAGFVTKLVFNTNYHPKTDGKTKRANRILEDMLKMYVMHQQSGKSIFYW